jgi:hypothetical protein
MRGLSFFRVAGGKLAEHWSCFTDDTVS